MVNKIKEIKKQHNGTVRIIQSKEHSNDKLKKALGGIVLPKGVSTKSFSYAR